MTIIHSDRLQISVDIFTNIFLIFSFLTAFYQFYIIGMERSSIEGQIKDAVQDMVAKQDVSSLAGLKDEIVQLEKLAQGDTDATTLTNKALFTNAWMISAFFGVMVIILAVSFFGYRKNPYFKKHPLSIADILFKNFWMFVVAGLLEFVFFMKIATKFTPVPPSAMGSTVANAIKTEFGSNTDIDRCPQKKLRAENGENCSHIWLCATKKNEYIAAGVMGAVLLATVLAITLQPLAFPFLFALQPDTLKGMELDQFSDLGPKAMADVRSSTLLGGKTPKQQQRPQRPPQRAKRQLPQQRRQRQQRQSDRGSGFSF